MSFFSDPLGTVEGWIGSGVSAIDGTIQSIANAFGSGVTWIAGEVNDLGNALATTVEDVAQFIGTALQQTFNALETVVVGYANALQQAYDSAEATFKTIDPSLYADINSGLVNVGNATTDFLKKYGHAIVDVVADYFAPGSSILIDLLWSEAENGWKPVPLSTLGIAAAEGLANEALPGVDSAISDILPEALGPAATGALNSAVETYIRTGGNATPSELLQGAVTSGLINSSLSTLPDITSALENVIPGLQSGVDFVQSAADELQGDPGLVEDTAAAIENLTQQEIVALGSKEINQFGAQVGLSAIVSTDGSVSLNGDQVLGLVADGLSVEVPAGDIVALVDTAQQINSFTSEQLQAISQTGVSVLRIADDVGVDLDLAQLTTFEQAGMAIADTAQVTLSDATSTIDSYITGLGVSQIDALKAAGIDVIQADASIALDVAQSAAAEAEGLLVDVPTGDVLSILDTAKDIDAMTTSQIQDLKTLGVGTITAEGTLALDGTQVAALEQAGVTIKEASGAIASLTDSGAAIAAMTVQEFSNLATTGIKDVISDSPVVLDAAQALELANEGVGILGPVGDVASLADEAASIESLTVQQIQSLGAAGIGALDLDATAVQLAFGQAKPGLALSVSQFAALASNGIDVVMPSVDDAITVIDSAADIVKDAVALKASQDVISVVDGVTGVLANLATLESDQITNLTLTVEDSISTLSSKVGTLTADMKTAGLYVGSTLAAVDTLADVTQAIANGSANHLVAASVKDWIIDDTNTQLNSSQLVSDITTLVGDGATEIDLEASGAVTALSFSAIQAAWNAAGQATLKLRSAQNVAVQLADQAVNIELLTAAQIAKLAQSDVSQIVAGAVLNSNNLSLNAQQFGAVVAAGISLAVSVKLVKGVVQLVDTAQNIESFINNLGPSGIAQLKAAGLNQLASSGGVITLGAADLLALQAAGCTATSILQDTAANIEALTAGQLGSIAEAGATSISVDGSLSLSISQAAAIAQAKLRIDVPIGSQLILSDAASAISALTATATELQSLEGLGIYRFEAQYSSVVLNLAQVLAFAAQDFVVSASAGNQVILQDTLDHIEGYTTEQIAAAGAAGVLMISSTGGGQVQLNVGQVLALEEAGVALASGALFDTAANIESLTAAQFAALGSPKITTITTSDGSSITLNVQQVEGLEQAGVYVSSGVILQDTGTAVQDMTIKELGKLQNVNVQSPIETTQPPPNLTAAQVNVLASEHLSVAANFTTESLEAIDSQAQVNALVAEGVTKIIMADNPKTVALTLQQLNWLMNDGIQILNPQLNAIPLTLQDGLANIEPVTSSQMLALEQYGVQSETVSDSISNFNAASAASIQSLETAAHTPSALSTPEIIVENPAGAGFVTENAELSGGFVISYGGGQLTFTQSGSPLQSVPVILSSPVSGQQSVAAGLAGFEISASISSTSKSAFAGIFANLGGAGFVSPVPLVSGTNLVSNISDVGLENGGAAFAWYGSSNNGGSWSLDTVVGNITAAGTPPSYDLSSFDTPVALTSATPTTAPSMAGLSNGGYVLAWGNVVGTSGNLNLAFLNSSGSLSTPIITPTTLNEAPSVAAANNANSTDVVVAYYGSGALRTLTYTETGSLVQGSAVTTQANEAPASIAALPDGDFILVWAFGTSIEGVLLGPQGQKIGNIFTIDAPVFSPVLGNPQDFAPEVAATTNQIVVSWNVAYSGGQVQVDNAVKYELLEIPPEPTFSVTDSISDILSLGTSNPIVEAADSSAALGKTTVKDTAANFEAMLSPAHISTLINSDDVETFISDGSLTFSEAQVSAFLAGGNITIQVPVNDSITLKDTAANIENLLASDLTSLQALGITDYVSTDTQLAFTFTQAEALVDSGDSFDASAPSGSGVWLTDSGSTLQNPTTGAFDLNPTQIANLGAAGFTNIDVYGGSSALRLSEAQTAALAAAGMNIRGSNFEIGFPSSLPGHGGPQLRIQSATLSDTAGDIELLSPEQIEQLPGLGVGEVVASNLSSVSLTVAKALAFASADVPLNVTSGENVSINDTSDNIEALTAAQISSLSGRIASISTTDLSLSLNLDQVLALEKATNSYYDFPGISINIRSVFLADTTAHILAMTPQEIGQLPPVDSDVEVGVNVSKIELTDALSDQPVAMTVAQYLNFFNFGWSLYDASGTTRLNAAIYDTAAAIEALTPGQINGIFNSFPTQVVSSLAAIDAPLVFSAAQFAAWSPLFQSGGISAIAAPGGITIEDSAADILQANLTPAYSTKISGIVLVDTVAHLEALGPSQIVTLTNVGVNSWLVGDSITDLNNLVVIQTETSTWTTLASKLPWKAAQVGWSVIDTAADIDALTTMQVNALDALGVTSITSTNGSVVISAAIAAELQTDGIAVTVPAGDTLMVSDTNESNISSFIKAKIVAENVGGSQLQVGSANEVTDPSLSVQTADTGPGVSLPVGQAVNAQGALLFSSGNGNAISVLPGNSANALTVELKVGMGNISVTPAGAASVAGNGGADVLITGLETDINATLASVDFGDPSLSDTQLTVSVTDGLVGAQGTVDIAGGDLGPSESLPGGQLVTSSSLAFNSAHNDAIVVGGYGNNNSTTTLTVSEGTLAIASAAGVVVTGNQSAALSISGASAAVNAALATLVYQPGSSFSGPDALHVTTSDGNISTAGQIELVGAGEFPGPSVKLPGGQSVGAGGSLAFNTGNGDIISIGGQPGAEITVDVMVLHGTLAVQTVGAASEQRSGDQRTMAITGSVADINATLQTLTYHADSNYVGNDNLAVSAVEAGATATAQIVLVDGLDHAPSNSMPGAQTIGSSGALTFNSQNGNAISVTDPNAGNIVVQLDSSHGQLSATREGADLVTPATGGDPLTISGSVADVNASLQTLSYQLENSNYVGSDVILMSTQDSEFNIVSTVSVETSASYQAPGLQLASSVIVSADAIITLSGNNAITVNAPANTLLTTTISIAQADATLSAVASGSASVQSSYSGGESILTINGDVQDTGATLQTLALQASANFQGGASVNIVTTDGTTEVSGSQTITSNAGGEITFTVGTDLTTQLSAGSIVTVSDTSANEGAGFNGQFLVQALTSSSVVVDQTGFTSPGLYAGGGTIDGAAITGATWSGTDLAEAPGEAVPAAQQLTSGTLAFNSQNGNAITVSDPENYPLTTSLNVTNGSLAVSAASGASVTDTLTLELSEAVEISGGTPTLSLSNGGTATYVGGSGSNQLTFSYTPTGSSSLTVTAINPNLASIADLDNNAVNLMSLQTGLLTSGVAITGTATSVNSTLATLTYQAAAGSATGDVLTATTQTAIAVTGASWSSSGGGLTTFTVATNLTGELSIGSLIDVSGANATGGIADGYNGQFVIVAVTSSSIKVARAPGSYESGGFIVSGGNDIGSVTGVTWPAANATQMTFTVSNLSSIPAANSVISVDGVVSTGGSGLGFNGSFVVVSATSNTIVVTPSSPGSYAGGGTIALGDVNSLISDQIVLMPPIVTPVIAVPGGQSLNTSNEVIFGIAEHNAIAVTGSGTTLLTTTVSVVNGTLSLTGTLPGGVTAQAISSGTGTNQFKLTGTAAGITQALNGLEYQPRANYAGIDELAIAVANGPVVAVNSIGITPAVVDLSPAIVMPPGQMIGQNGTLNFGASASSAITVGSQTSSLSVQLSIEHGILNATAANAAKIVGVLTMSFASPVMVSGGTPTLMLVGGGTATYAGGSGSNVLTFNYTAVAGENTANLAVAQVVLNSASATDSSGNTVSLTGPLTNVGSKLEIDGSSSDINATLLSLRYQEDAGYVGDDTLSLTASDGTYQSSNQVVLSAASADPGPSCSVPGGQLILLDGQVAFSTATGSAITVAVVNNSNISVQLNVEQGSLAVQAQGAASVRSSTGALYISGSVGDVNATLNTLIYTENPGYHGSDQINLLVSDGIVGSSASINLESSDDGPGVSLPAGQPIGATGEVSFGSAFSNAISVSSPGGFNLITTVSVTEGALSATAQGQASISIEGSSLVIKGSESDTNATLGTLTYQENSNFSGSDTLSVSTTDGTRTSSTSIALASPSLTVASSSSLITAKRAEQGFTVTGTASAAGQVTVELFDAVGNLVSGQSYAMTVASAGGTFSVSPNLHSLADGDYSVVSTLTVSGVISAPQIESLSLHTTPPGISMNVLDSGSVNGADAVAGLAISGSLTGIVAGSLAQVTVEINDGSFLKTYTGTVSADGTEWFATVPASDAEALPNGNAEIIAEVTDQYGNVSNPTSQAVQISEVIIQNGQVDTIASGHTDVGDVVLNGGTLDVANGGQVENAVVEAGGTINVESGGSEVDTAVAGGNSNVGPGGTSTGTTILNGGRETIAAGGIAQSPTIQGGTLELSSGAEAFGGIQFRGIHGTLQIDGIIPSVAIDGFGSSDAIDLAAVKYDALGTVVLAPDNVLKISENGTSYSIQLDPNANFVGENFVLGNAGSLGTSISILPQLSVQNVSNATLGETLGLSGLVTISDMGNVGYQLLELWDSDGTAAGGQFVVNGVAQTGGHEVDVAPGNVAGTVFNVGSVAGTDTLWARLLENTGGTTAWLEMTVSVPTPTLSVMNDSSVTTGSVVNLSDMVTILDPSNVGYEKLELWDSNGTSAGGQFIVNGVGQSGGHEIDVAPANVANTVFDVGTSGATDTLWALLVQNDGTSTGWEQFSVGAQPPTLSVSNDPAATRGQTISLSNLVTIADPSNEGYEQLELWDDNGTAAGGQFVVNGAAQTGVHEIDVAPSNVANTVFDVGSTSLSDTLWARLEFNNGSTSAWQSHTIAVPEVALSVDSDNNATAGEQLALANLVNVIDAGNVGYQRLELWDSNGTPAGGEFVVNGIAQTGGDEIDVNPANVANTVFDVGTAGGTDTLWARVLQTDGTVTSWQEFTIAVPQPTLTVQSVASATKSQAVDLSNLITIMDPSNAGYGQLQLWDSNGTAAGGQFIVNGVAQTGGHEIDVSPANVAGTIFDVGSTAGNDTLWARLQQDDGSTAAWESFTVTVPIPILSVSNDAGALPGQTINLSSLVTLSDPGNVGFQTLELWDSNGTLAGGQFVVDGVAQTGNHEIDVLPANVASTVFNVGSAGGSDTLWARLLQSNGSVTAWQELNVSVPAPSLTVNNDSGATPSQQISLSTLVAISDPSNVGYGKLELWDSNGSVAGGQFAVNGVAQTGGHEIDIAPANVANTIFNVGTSGGSDTLWARLEQNDGSLTAWQQFEVIDPVHIATGATVELLGPYGSSVTFDGASGALQLDQSSSFTGTVAGLTGEDTLDLRDMSFTSVNSPTFSGNASTGILTVTDGSHIANINLMGNYIASSFVASSDGHGGTYVTQASLSSQQSVMLTQPAHA
jgi:hypothetical protein